jgi:hypothetical protein
MSISRLPQALYLIFSISAAIAGPARAQITDGVIKIGVITDMNGPLSSATGRGSVEAARMAAEEFGSSIHGGSKYFRRTTKTSRTSVRPSFANGLMSSTSMP